jgi:hypothetical protein
MLIYTISTEPQPTMKVNIRNQYSDFKLTDRGFFSTSESWYGYPNWEVNTGNMISVGFKPSLSVFEGALTYVLQRKYVASNEQFRSTHIRLFVVWKSEGYKELSASVNLIEYDRVFHWDNAKLERYCQRYISQLDTYTDPIEDTWSTHDGIVLMTRLELDFTQRDGVLNITISKGVRDNHSKRSEWVNLKR